MNSEIEFEIGEQAILVDADYPVQRVEIQAKEFGNFCNNRTNMTEYGMFLYTLDIPCTDGVGFGAESLRKIPPMSKYSFHELMNKLNQPSKLKLKVKQ